ncbi:MAG: non-homologous end-joining DNA ligase [Acidimicrobiia bacterium]
MVAGVVMVVADVEVVAGVVVVGVSAMGAHATEATINARAGRKARIDLTVPTTADCTRSPKRGITHLLSPSSYDQKRSVDSTPEPPGEHVSGDVDPVTAPTGDSYVIQQHHATALHHDVRLEMMNRDTLVLVSWAVPKGLPRKRGDRHLAIRTEDHPIDYANFAGTIPEGEYGGGVVRIFDRGHYEMVDRNEERLTFRLDGERLRGVYHLVHTGPMDGKDGWLAIMSEDNRPPSEPQPDPDPMLATLTDEAFDDPDWWFEPKWDGIRAIAICSDETRLVSRNRKDITVAYPELETLHRQVVSLDAMLDGEIVAFDEGVPSFQRLQQRMHLRDPKRVAEMAKSIPVAYLVFDLIYLDGRDLTGEPLEERRLLLEEAVVPDETIQLSPVTDGDGVALFRAAQAQGLEGIMAKRRSSHYRPGARSSDWLKVKVVFDADVVIVGWTEGVGRRKGTLGSLVMAVYDRDALRYVGNVGTGFDQSSLRDAMERLTALEETDRPFPAEMVRSRPELRNAHWVSPELVARVEHRQLTDAGRLRAPSFQGFREDKEPEECTWEHLVAEAGAG